LGLACLLFFATITAPTAQATGNGLGTADTGFTTIEPDARQSIVPELLIDTEGETLEGYLFGIDIDVLGESVAVSVEPATKIEEPQTGLLVGVGLAGLAVSGRKKRTGRARRQRQLTHTLASTI